MAPLIVLWPWQIIKGIPLVGGGWTGGGGESRKIGLSPHAPICFDQKYQFCNFHAVFGHFAQIVPPPVNLIWETLQKINF